MKQILTIIICIAILNTACTQSSTTPTTPPATTGYSIDSTYYFKINFNGQTLCNYGLKFSDGVTSSLFGYAGAFISSQNGISSFSISNTGSLFNNALLHTNVLPVITSFIKTGNSTGLYSADSNLFAVQITDLNTSKIYSMDNTTTANVTSVSVDKVIGTLSGNLIDGSTLIPVTASFSLKKL